MTRIVLIQPRSELIVQLFGKLYMLSNTLPVVASTIPGHLSITIIDENVQEIPFGFFTKGTLVGITCLTPTAPRAYEIADILKEEGVSVILGGMHPTILPDEALRHADSVVVGEVEGLWPAIIADFEKGMMKKVYKNDRVPDITLLPKPRFDLIDPKYYWQWSTTNFSRGCPHSCSFCSATKVFGGKVRFRSVESVIDEVVELKKRGARLIFFSDDNIAINPEKLTELCEALIPLKIKWLSQCHARVSQNHELLSLLRDSGCVGMLVGFETVNLNAQISHKNRGVDIEKAIATFHQYGIILIGCFICGLPGATDGDFQRVQEIIEKSIDIPQISVLTAYPGTKDYETAQANDLLLHRPWSDYTITKVVSTCGDQSPEWLQDQYDTLASTVYSNFAILRRVFRVFLQQGLYKAYVALVVNLVYQKLVSFRDITM